MNAPENVAKAVYFIEGDEEAAEYQSIVIEYLGERWLVATWLQHLATGTKYPERIVPMKLLPHVTQENGLIRLGLLMPLHSCRPRPRQNYCNSTAPRYIRRYFIPRDRSPFNRRFASHAHSPSEA